MEIHFTGLESLDGECCVTRGLGSDDHCVDGRIIEDILELGQTAV